MKKLPNISNKVTAEDMISVILCQHYYTYEVTFALYFPNVFDAQYSVASYPELGTPLFKGLVI